jgi:hypothetical protein
LLLADHLTVLQHGQLFDGLFIFDMPADVAYNRLDDILNQLFLNRFLLEQIQSMDT